MSRARIWSVPRPATSGRNAPIRSTCRDSSSASPSATVDLPPPDPTLVGYTLRATTSRYKVALPLTDLVEGRRGPEQRVALRHPGRAEGEHGDRLAPEHRLERVPYVRGELGALQRERDRHQDEPAAAAVEPDGRRARWHPDPVRAGEQEEAE